MKKMEKLKIISLMLLVIYLNGVVFGDTISAVNIPMTDQIKETWEVVSHTSSDGRFIFELDEQYNYYATITGYIGNEADVTVPAQISDMSGTYVVETLQNTFARNSVVENVNVSEGILNIKGAFTGETKLKSVILPASIGSIEDESFNASNKLTNITVDSENETYFTRNGILYYKFENEIYLQTYPAGKLGSDFIIDKDVSGIKHAAFRNSQFLQNVTIPSTIKNVYTRAFNASANEINIYFKPDTFDEIEHIASDAFYDLPSGSKIFVQTPEIAAEIPNHMQKCVDTTVVDMSQDASTQKKAQSLSFEGDTTTKNMTLGVGETNTNLLTAYTVSPADTTDNVTWTSSDESVATVNATTGKIETLKTGTTTITGRIEGSSLTPLTVELTVYKQITDVSINEDRSYELVEAELTKYAMISVAPVDANNRDKVTWKSSNPQVAEVDVTREGVDTGAEYLNYGTLHIKSPGTTTITASINDNGTIIEKTFTLTITKPKVEISTITVTPINTVTYTGASHTPVLEVKNGSTTLIQGTDYNVTYDKNTNAGTATVILTGIGDYTGTKTTSFRIVPKNISGAAISDMAAQTYTGADIQPAVTVHLDNRTLMSGSDYMVEYSNNQNVGTATVKITGRGNYSGTVTSKFAITKESQTIKVTKNYQKPYGSKAFTVSVKRTKGDGALSYQSSNTKVATVSASGKVTIKGIGWAIITVTSNATANFNAANATITITVTPKKATISYLKSTSKKKLTVKWKKDTKASGYQVQYSINSKFKSAKTVTIKKNKTTAQTTKKLKSGKKYYVRVRAYKKFGKSKIYGSWSKARSYKVK